jgi:tRNA pseudouridine55 synthase
MTSHDVVNFLRRLTGEAKVGHTGTLDSEAAGVLPVCLGKATRVISFLRDDKEYRAEVTFGVKTSTHDSFGEVLSERDASHLTLEMVEKALANFRGKITQVPPMTSARHYQGKKLYLLARKGEIVTRQPKQVTIYQLNIVRDQDFRTAHPRLLLDVVCTAGTYIRTLCNDLGDSLGCGAYMSFLLRTRAGLFTLSNALTIENLFFLVNNNCLDNVLMPMNKALSHLPAVELKKEETVKAVREGRTLRENEVKKLSTPLTPGQIVRLTRPNGLAAIARVEVKVEGYWFRPIRVLV